MVKIDSKRERGTSESSDVVQMCKKRKLFPTEDSFDDPTSPDSFDEQESIIYTSR